MQIVRHYHECPESLKNSSLALGNFDGLHLGHMKVIREAIDIAKKSGIPSAIMTFEPHPLNTLKPKAPLERLTPFRDKMLLLEELGIDAVFCITFNHKFSLMNATKFVEDVLVNHLKIKHLITGNGFIFGHNRGGNAELLSKMSELLNFGYSPITASKINGIVSSSSHIRKLLRNGEIFKANQMLGRSYVISGIVQNGEKNGRKLGFPTVNLSMKGYLSPATGAYIAEIIINGCGKSLAGVANIGTRPTLEGKDIRLEAHILNFSEELYGKRVEIRLVKHIRPEVKFDGMDSLKNQIALDCRIADEFFSSGKIPQENI